MSATLPRRISRFHFKAANHQLKPVLRPAALTSFLKDVKRTEETSNTNYKILINKYDFE